MTEKQIWDNAKRFEELLEDTGRRGVEDMLSWLRGTDFYKAPSSTVYHLAEPGGLCQHSLNVYRRAIQEYELREQDYPGITFDSIVITALLHDVCKANSYTTYSRNVKDENGKWQSVQAYKRADTYPLGHGEKSLYLVCRNIDLSADEAMAIRWHMGAFDDAVQGGFRGLADVYSKYPLAYLIHQADEKATYFDEK